MAYKCNSGFELVSQAGNNTGPYINSTICDCGIGFVEVDGTCEACGNNVAVCRRAGGVTTVVHACMEGYVLNASDDACEQVDVAGNINADKDCPTGLYYDPTGNAGSPGCVACPAGAKKCTRQV